MPTYHYRCERDHLHERISSIAEMEEYEACMQRCPECGKPLHRELSLGQKTVRFKEGFYEHISENGEHISSMGDLKRIAKENGNYSRYAEDMGGLWRAKEGRWI